MNQIARTFTLVGLVVVILLAMHLLPTLQIGDTELRPVSILSDVTEQAEQTADVIDVPEVPDVPVAPVPPSTDTSSATGSRPVTDRPARQDVQPITSTDTTGNIVVDLPEEDMEMAEGDSIVMIADYSGGALGNSNT